MVLGEEWGKNIRNKIQQWNYKVLFDLVAQIVQILFVQIIVQCRK